MSEFIIHRITPISWPLILRRTSSLKAEPRLFRALHITSADTGFVVEGAIDLTVLFMGYQVKLGDEIGDDQVVELFHVGEREIFEVVTEVDPKLTYDIVRYNLLCFRVVGGTHEDDVVSVRIPSCIISAV